MSQGATLHPVARWLLQQAEGRVSAEQLLEQLNLKLREFGIPTWRSSINVHTLHPEVFVRNIVWNREEGSQSTTVRHLDLESDTFRNSPVSLIYEGSGPIRKRLTESDESLYFPVCVEMKQEGGTDYIILPVRFTDGRRTYASFATDRPGGFTDEDIGILTEIIPYLALRVELESSYFATRSLLELYLGQNASRRVIDGEFKRAAGQELHCALWYCDLRDFTDFSDGRDPREVVEMLDYYFESVANPVRDNGGEVLKFIGDAMLAIFDFSRVDPWEGCRNALVAANEAISALARPSKWGPIALGVGLHVGRTVYGNIGSKERLDFTIIGPPVNEVCRVESLCKKLGLPLVMTKAFASNLRRDDLVSLGRHRLKGVKEDPELFTLGAIDGLGPTLGHPVAV